MSDSRRVFEWHNNNVLSKNNEMEDLLKKLGLPVLIKMVVKYTWNNNIPTSELYKAVKDGHPFKFLEPVFKDLTRSYLIFEPLIASVP